MAPWRDAVQIMGLPISVALRGRHAGDDVARAAWTQVKADLHEVDAMFSSYREDSWISRHNAGTVDLADAPPEVREVMALAEEARTASLGAFDVWRRGPTGRSVLDTDGVVKGWALQRAARHLVALPDTDSCLGGGGDIACWTAEPEGVPWHIGIEHPRNPRTLVGRVPVRRGGVATSSESHRGQHIVDARSGRLPTDIVSATVVESDLFAADIDATAAFAHGPEAMGWLRSRSGLSALVVWSDGRVETL